MILTAQRYDTVPAAELLREVEKGRVGFDHRVIRSLDGRREETLAALAGWALEKDPDRLVDLDEQAFDLYRHFRAPEGAAYYAEMLRGNPGEVPDALIEAFVELGAASVEPLLKLYEELGEEDGADVAFVLAALRVKDERILQLLLKTLERDPYEGALCLEVYGDAGAIPAVHRALDELEPGQQEERKALADAIESLKQPLSEAAGAPEFDIWKLYPEEATPLFGAMRQDEALEFLDCDVAEYRAEAALSYCDEEYPDEVRDALMKHAGSDPETAVRACCLRALGERAEEPEIRALLTSALEDLGRAEAERCGALVGLSHERDNEKVQQAVLRFYEDAGTRAAALEAMWRSLDFRYADYFVRHAEDVDKETRRRAIQGMGAFNLSQHAHLLVPSLNDDDLREEALFAYALAMPGKTTRKSVHGLLEKIDEHAGGLTASEVEVVEFALDRRLERDGLEAEFHPDESFEDEFEHEPAVSTKVGRNEPCPCGSGKKYKKCCGAAV